MAVKDCETVSNIIAVAIVSGDDELAQEIAKESLIKNSSLQKSRDLKQAGENEDAITGLTAHELELRASSADIKIRAMVQASILKGGKGNEAFLELARQIVKEKGGLAEGTMLLELVRNASATNYADIARLWDDSLDVATAMKDLNDGLAEFISSNYSIRKYSDFFEGEISKAKKKFKDGKIDREKYNEEVQKAHKRAMDRIAKGENPTGFVPMDKERQAIKKVFGDDPKQAGRAWSNYVMARELLADGGLDEDMLAAFDFGGEMLLGDLTIGQINKCNDLDKLLMRAFTNTEQLYRDKALRDAYRNKLTQLTSGKKLTKDNTKKIQTLINVSLFAEKGATLSEVLLDNRAYLSMKQMGYKVSERDGRKIYNDLRKFSEKLAKGDDPELLSGKIKIAGQEVQAGDLLQLIYDITGDKNILVLVSGGNFSDKAVLNIAVQKLLGDDVKAKKALMQLFEKGKQGIKATDSRGIFLRAITGIDVPTGSKVAFFDYRQGLYYKDELSSLYADYMDKLAEKNKMRVPSDGIDDITKVVEDTDENVNELVKVLEEKAGGGFLIVNDARYKDNPLLRKALNKISEDKKITVLFPRAEMAANFSMKDGVVYYKTIDDALFNRVAGSISIQSLGEAKPTREMVATAYEAETGLKGDKLRYQASYNDGFMDSVGRKLSDQQGQYFAASVVRDANGNLIPVFHGTSEEFDMFDMTKLRSFAEGPGIYFAEATNFADTYGGRTIECYLNITNPLVYDMNNFKNFDKVLSRDTIRGLADFLESRGLMDKSDVDWVRRVLNEDDTNVWSAFEITWYKADREKRMGEYLEAFKEFTGYDGIHVIYKNFDKSTPDFWVAFSPEQIKYVDNRLPTIDPDMRYQLIGPQGLRNLIKDYPDYVSRYNEAVEMLEHGVPPEEIYRETGLSVSAWGDIEFEIPGTNKFTSKFDGIIAYREQNPIDGDRNKFKKEFIKKVKKEIKTIGDIIDNPELFAAYPELKNRPVKFEKMKDDTAGAYSRLYDDFTFDTDNIMRNDESDWRDLISHEIQHYIQKHEGHTFKVHKGRVTKKIEWRAVNFLYNNMPKELRDIRPARVESSWAKYPRLMFVHEHYNEILDWLKANSPEKLEIWKEELEAYAKIEKNWEKGRKKMFDQIDKNENELYYREAGESQSYAVGYRERNWNATRGTLPSRQEPYPREMQLMFDVFWNEITGYHYIPAGLEDMFQQRYLRALQAEDEELVRDILDEYAMVKHFEPLKGKIDFSVPEIAEHFKTQFRTVIWNDKPMDVDKVPVRRPLQTSQPTSTLALPYYEDAADLPASNAFKLQMFTKDRTWGEIAEGYGFSVEYIHGTNMIWGVRAYGAYGNGIIYFTDIIKESTPPHELFHGVFNMYVKSKDPDQYTRILEQSAKQFGISEREAEEILANEFAHWFNTGEFRYGEAMQKEMLSKKKGLKEEIKTKKLNKEQKSIIAKVLEFFKEIKKQLGLLDAHRAEVKQMFQDIVDMKYLPDDGMPISAEGALVRYNDELNKAAIAYFGKVLGLSTDVIDKEYIDRVQKILSDSLGIDINAFNTFDDKSELWQRIDRQLTLERMTAGRFDRDFVDVNKVRSAINGYSDEYIAKRIEQQFGSLIKGGTILGNENFDLIKEAWFEYNIATNATDLLSAKGKIISLVNGVPPQTLSLNDIREMFKNKTFSSRYKEMFFPEQEVSEEDMETFIKQINSDIFDGLSIGFAENLVNAGYNLPLVSVKKFVYDYLNGKLDINSDFIQALFYKNEIPFTRGNLEMIVDTFMPKQYSFDFTTLKGELDEASPVGEISRVREVKNRFLPDSYSALYAMEDAGKGITLGNKEYDVLKGMIDKYIAEVMRGMSEQTLDFGEAQRLKQELAYAIDAFEQDYILPKYGPFMSQAERQSLLGLKYSIPIGVTGQPSSKVEDMLMNWRKRILGTDNGEDLGWFRSMLGTMNDNFDINAAIAKGYDASTTPEDLKKRIEKRRDQLMANGSTIKEVDGQYIVYNSKDALWDTLQTLPDNIQGLESLKVLGRAEIDNMTNKEAYVLLRYIEAAKALATTANYATQLMYKQSPQLAQYSFFSTYVIDPETKLPKIMRGNALASDEFFSDIASAATSDQLIKKDIFDEIVKKFRKDGYILPHSKEVDGKVTEKGLDDIIKGAISRQIDEMETVKFASSKDKEKARQKMQNIYTNMFIPYTYLRDIPSGGALLDGGAKEKGGPLINVKKKVETTMKEAYNLAIEDLKAAGATDADRIQQIIHIKTDDGQNLSLGSLADIGIDDWKKQIFGDESILVRSADKEEEFVWAADDTPTKRNEIAAQEREYRERIQNEYLSTFNTMLNQGQFITDSERALMTAFMRDVRTELRKYEGTSRMLDAMDATSGLSEEVARGIKYYLIGFWGTVTFGRLNKKEIIDRYMLIRDAYKKYYEMSWDQLGKARPKGGDRVEEVAWNTARYFKNLERMLGSADGSTGVTTSKLVNRKFFHIGEVFMNLNADVTKGGVKGIFAMLSAIEQNQVLKFFKFSKEGSASYYKPFVQNPLSAGGGNFWDGMGGYRDYVQDVNAITQVEFNRLFGANYDEPTFKRVLQGLTGFTISGGGLARVANKIFDMLSASNIALRMIMSYPGQLLTIPLQGTAYFLKQIGQELSLGIEDLSTVDDIREQFGILDGALNELHILGKTNFNPDSKDVNSFYNRYGIPDISSTYKNTGITAADDYINMYAKMDTKFSKFNLNELLSNVAKWFDPYKDNANNFIDGIFARNFKNIAFIKGLRDNNFMKFADARAFADFMNNPEISNDVKSRLLDAVAASSGRNFRNILGLGFGGVDRAIGANQYHNILFGLMQMFNFRGSWGQNIFKQTGRIFWNYMQFAGTYVGLTKATREEIAKYIFYSPEFTNFMTAFLYDMEWAFKLTRYQDNGRWPDEDEDGLHYFLDYLTFMKENLSMVSQRWQGIQSFGAIRPFLEQGESIMASQMDPTVYKDTYGVGAFINALGNNFLRQWKPVAWITELIGAWYSGGPENARAYLNNRVFNLSFGSIRYMVNEDKNAYGYTYEVTGQYGGIPAIGMGEAPIGSDKSFQYALNNNETWDSLKLAWDSDLPWNQRWTYHKNVNKAMINGSQFFSALKNVWNILPTGEWTDSRYDKVFFSGDDFSKAIQSTEAGKEFYSKGYVIPKTPEEANTFIKTILNHAEYRPGSSKFNKSLMQFDDFGHMAGEKGNEADVEMELWLEHMKYQTNDRGEFILKDGKKVVDPSWEALIKNAKTFYGNQDYVTQLVYNYSKGWLDNHQSDPNYPLYIKMLGQGQAYMLIENEIEKRIDILNKIFKKDWKWSEIDYDQSQYRDMLLSMGNSVLSGDNMTFFERLNRLDEDDATLAALRIIENQAKGENLEIISRFFVTKTSKYDGEEVESIEFRPAYKSQLEQIGRISRAMDEGNVERVISMSSNLVNLYKDKDPTGIITANLIDSMYDRIYDSPNLTPKQKQEMMIGIFYNNKEFVQHNPEKLREKLGDNYDNYTKLMNEMLYKRDGKVISNLESLQTSGEADKKSTAGAKDLSDAFKNAMTRFGSSGGGTTSVGKVAGMGYLQWVPVKIQGADLVKDLGLKGYSPLNVKQTVLKYTPHVDLSQKKDINRSVKAKGTESVSTKKQLSNLEKKTTKALEAES